VILDFLKVLEDECKVFEANNLFAGYYDRNGKEIYVLQAIVGWEDAFPDPQGIEESEILSIKEGNPTKTIVEGVNL